MYSHLIVRCCRRNSSKIQPIRNCSNSINVNRNTSADYRELLNMRCDTVFPVKNDIITVKKFIMVLVTFKKMAFPKHFLLHDNCTDKIKCIIL